MVENNQLSVVNIEGVRGYIDSKGIAWLNLEDVSRGLGFTETKNGKDYVMWRRVYQYLREFSFGTNAEENNSQLTNQDMYIPEEIFYRLAMKANNEVANRFQIKIATEILPNLRKEGYHIVSGREDEVTAKLLMKIMTDPKSFIKILVQLDEERDRRILVEEQNKKLQEENQILLPKAKSFDVVLNTDTYISIKTVADLINIAGMGRNNLIKWFRNKGIFLPGQRVPYRKYIESGHFKVVEVRTPKGFMVNQTLVSQKGLDYIIKLLLEDGYQPRCQLGNKEDWKKALEMEKENQKKELID